MIQFFFFSCCSVIQVWFINICILFSYEVASKQDASHVMHRSNHETRFYLSAFTVPVKQLVGKHSSYMFSAFYLLAFHLTWTFVMKILHSCAEHSMANLSDKILWKMFNLDQGLWTFLLSGAELASSLSLVWSVGTCPNCFISAWWNVCCCTFARHFFSS